MATLDEDINEEVWKDVSGNFWGKENYECSNMGNETTTR